MSMRPLGLFSNRKQKNDIRNKLDPRILALKVAFAFLMIVHVKSHIHLHIITSSLCVNRKQALQSIDPVKLQIRKRKLNKIHKLFLMHERGPLHPNIMIPQDECTK